MALLKETYTMLLRALGGVATVYGQPRLSQIINRVADGINSTTNVDAYMAKVAETLTALHAEGETFTEEEVDRLISEIEDLDEQIENL